MRTEDLAALGVALQRFVSRTHQRLEQVSAGLAEFERVQQKPALAIEPNVETSASEASRAMIEEKTEKWSHNATACAGSSKVTAEWQADTNRKIEAIKQRLAAQIKQS